MRELPAALAAHLANGATTLCTCWRIIWRDGEELCFTDHDRDIAFDMLTFSAATGVEGASSEASLGLAASGSEIAGALMAESLTEADLLEGLYDGARIEIWRVNWADPVQRILLDAASFGEVRRTGDSFAVELRSISALFDQEAGRIYQHACQAELGDARCGVDMNDASHSQTVAISSCADKTIVTFGAAPFADGALNGGRLEVLDGVHAGSVRAIESHRNEDGANWLRLWRPLAGDLPTGTQVRVSVGCDKSFSTCRDVFTNTARFRGFPHMPGNDALLAHASGSSAAMNGGSLFR